MMNHISTSKELHWVKPVGVFFLSVGFVSFIPFNWEGWHFWELLLRVFGVIGLIFLAIAFLKLGWSITLEDNILFYSKFNLYSDLKQRRAKEFTLVVSRITKIVNSGSYFEISYSNPSGRISLNTTCLSRCERVKLIKLKTEIGSRIIDQDNA